MEIEEINHEFEKRRRDEILENSTSDMSVKELKERKWKALV